LLLEQARQAHPGPKLQRSSLWFLGQRQGGTKTGFYPAVRGFGRLLAQQQLQEVERLLDALAELHECHPELATDVDGFGEELAAWLETCRGKALLLIAT
jgi:hypothetical protein